MLSTKLISIGLGIGGTIGWATGEIVLWIAAGLTLGIVMDISRIFKTKSATSGQK